jgi:hypothetical protein
MGANPSIANNDGETPVMIAKVLGQEQIAQVVVEKSVSQYLNSTHIYLDLESSCS